MKLPDSLGLTLVSLTLFIGAVVIKQAQIWSVVANHALPWLCTALALAILVLAATAHCTGQRPSTIPDQVAKGVVAAMAIVLGVGFLLDSIAYEPSQSFWSGDQFVTLSEWLGQTLLLAGVFYAARAGRASPGRCPACDYDLKGNTSGVCPECGAGTAAESQRRGTPDS